MRRLVTGPREDRIGGRAGFWIGVVMLAHYALLVALKVRFDALSDLFWTSHVALLVAAVGLIAGSTLLVTTALASIFVVHVVWMIDAVVGALTGMYPLGLAAYVADASLPARIGTTHHAYLVPVLLLLVLRHRRFPAATAPCALLLVATLTLVSRFALDPVRNINAAFLFMPGVDHPVSDWVNRQGTLLYLLALNFFAGVVCVLPVCVVLRRRCDRSLKHGEPRRATEGKRGSGGEEPGPCLGRV